MTMDWVSLSALLLIIFLSRWEHINVGILAIGLAWGIGLYWAGIDLTEIFGSFPLSLFLVLFGVTFFFNLAQVNGSLKKIIDLVVHSTRGRTFTLPVTFFCLALVLAAIGPGNIGAVALLSPLAMAIAVKTGISPFFMTVMLVNGANAGAFSPFSPTGIIANGLIEKLGMEMDPWTQVFLPSLLAQSFIALGCYVVLMSRMRRQQIAMCFHADEITKSSGPLDRRQIITVLAIVLFVTGIIFLKFDIGFWAITLAAGLMLCNVADGKAAMAVVPWGVIMMVCGVSMLINVMAKTGGLDLFIGLLGKVSSPDNVTGVLAFVVGIISSYSSSSGVIMPAFIPIVPGLIEKIGSGDPVALVASINVGSHVVDVSPLSTLGALCLAQAAKYEDKNKLFRQLLVFGLSMSLVGATICYLFFGKLGWYQ